MNETDALIATLRRMNAVFMGALLLFLCSCMQGAADPGSTFHKGLQRDAWRTLEAYDAALLAHREKTGAEVPPTCWDPGIQRLHPVKVHMHRGNLVVVQKVTDGMEQGKYIELPVSPFHPKSTWFSHKHAVDAFVFRPAIGKGVFNYTRRTSPLVIAHGK